MFYLGLNVKINSPVWFIVECSPLKAGLDRFRPIADIRAGCENRAMNDQATPHSQLDATTAFDAMRLFLEAYWERGGRLSDDLAVLLGGLQRLDSDGMPIDLAMWSDWIAAIERALSRPANHPSTA
ncbi:hypothetical protein [Sphingosinicella sp.]|uniref:hypothetical protein n=1 Tax=Sphingosinicella sp. TaxID=1917971 RepID=UPI004037942C